MKIPSVEYCKNSTITEAWAAVVGVAGPVSEDEIGALVHLGGKRIEDLTPVKSVVLVHKPHDPSIPPFWDRQFQWQGHTHLVRVGHRYLSVHFLLQGNQRYKTFKTSMEPALQTWLDVYEETIGQSAEAPQVEKVVYGYVNTFNFDVADFALDTYFRLNLGIDMQTIDGLSELDVTFKHHNVDQSMDVIVNLLVQAPQGPTSRVKVQTKIFAENRATANVSMADSAKIMTMMAAAKECAKEAFFDFATETTHQKMGATNAEDGE